MADKGRSGWVRKRDGFFVFLFVSLPLPFLSHTAPPRRRRRRSAASNRLRRPSSTPGLPFSTVFVTLPLILMQN